MYVRNVNNMILLNYYCVILSYHDTDVVISNATNNVAALCYMVHACAQWQILCVSLWSFLRGRAVRECPACSHGL